MIKRLVLSLFGLMFCLHAYSAEVEAHKAKAVNHITPVESQRIYSEIQQFWLLAQAYRYGVVVPKDNLKSLIYENLYLRCLPQNYPYKSKMLSAFSVDLPPQSKSKIEEQTSFLQSRLSFTCPVTYTILKQGLVEQSADVREFSHYLSFQSFDDFLQVVGRSSPELKKHYDEAVRRGNFKRDRWVYGQLHVEGVDHLSEGILEKVEGINLDEKGFFLVNVTERSLLTITLPTLRFHELVVDLSESRGQAGLINLNHLSLTKDEPQKLSTIVGEHKPNTLSAENSFVTLVKASDEKEEPTFIYLSRLADGKFYRKNLSPGDYRLFLANANSVLEKELRLRAGETKQLKSLTLDESHLSSKDDRRG